MEKCYGHLFVFQSELERKKQTSGAVESCRSDAPVTIKKRLLATSPVLKKTAPVENSQGLAFFSFARF